MSPDLDVLIVGGGQAGLGTAAWLRRLAPRCEVAVLERSERLGESWRERWDSLRLFTPRAFSALPGLAFPAGPTETPDRLEMAAYLERYAAHFTLPVRLGVNVERVEPAQGGFAVHTGAECLTARQIVVANGPFHNPAIPPAAAGLGADVTQLHSYHYRRPGDLPGERVVVVGGGNSAAQIALELSASKQVTLVTPGQPWLVPDHLLGLSSYRWMSALGILDADAHGRVARYIRRRGDAIFGRELAAPLARKQIALRPHRVVGAQGNALSLQDGSSLQVEAVLWCTGFHSVYPWLDVPGALDGAGNPVHDRGASRVPGLHWMGLPWQSTLDSSIIHGIDADARRCAQRILDRAATAPEIT